MSRSKNFSQLYGYTLHPDSVENKCFWCDRSCGNTFDYTPHRTIGRDQLIVDHLNLEKISVTACTSCIGNSTNNKMTLLTIFDKRMYFEQRKMALDGKTAKISDLLTSSPVRPWQLKLENGDVIDKPDYELTDFDRKMRDAWYEEQDRIAKGKIRPLSQQEIDAQDNDNSDTKFVMGDFG